MKIKISRFSLYGIIFYCVLSGCGQGDRGGVSLGDPINSGENNGSSSSAAVEGKLIISSVGKCLEMYSLDYLEVANLATIQSWDCTPYGAYQRWVWNESGSIQSANGLCLALGDDYGWGVQVVGKPCAEDDDQHWEYDDFTYAIKNVTNDNYCLDIYNNNLQLNGRNINVVQCSNAINQRWTIADLDAVHIRNYLDENLFLNIEPTSSGAGLKVSKILEGWASASWLIEPSEGNYRIRNLWKPEQFLHIQNDTLELASGAIEPGWLSARWILVPRTDLGDNTFLLRNYWKPNLYVGLDSEKILVIDEFSNLIDSSYIWVSSVSVNN